MSVTKIIDNGNHYKATIDGEDWFVPKDGSDSVFLKVQEAISSGLVVEDPEPVPGVIPTELTKLQIFDQVAQMEEDDPDNYSGLWASIESFIESDSKKLKRWNLAIGISSQDTLLEDLRLALGWTEEQKTQFLIAAGSRQ